jgi:hypothetical protein
MDSHSIWAYVHILLFVYWLGADAGLYLVMAMVKNPVLSFETRTTLIRLAFYIDLFPRITFALILPVGMHLARDLGLYPIGDGLLALSWIIGILWSGVHLGIARYKGTPAGTIFKSINKVYEAVGGLFFVSVAVLSIVTGAPIDTPWFAWKLLAFGLIFWVILGFDTMFQPFTTILRMGPDGSTPEMEKRVTSMTRMTMAWSVLLYLLIAAVAFIGRVKPF